MKCDRTELLVLEYSVICFSELFLAPSAWCIFEVLADIFYGYTITEEIFISFKIYTMKVENLNVQTSAQSLFVGACFTFVLFAGVS